MNVPRLSVNGLDGLQRALEVPRGGARASIQNEQVGRVAMSHQAGNRVVWILGIDLEDAVWATCGGVQQSQGLLVFLQMGFHLGCGHVEAGVVAAATHP